MVNFFNFPTRSFEIFSQSANLPYSTCHVGQDLKKEYAERKKTIKKNIKDDLKEDSKRLEAIQKSGHDMIEYMKGENLKLRQKQEAMKNEYKVGTWRLNVTCSSKI